MSWSHVTLHTETNGGSSDTGVNVARLANDFLVGHPGAECRKMKGMRKFMRVDRELVWNALVARLPEVGNYVRSILTDDPPPSS